MDEKDYDILKKDLKKCMPNGGIIVVPSDSVLDVDQLNELISIMSKHTIIKGIHYFLRGEPGLEMTDKEFKDMLLNNDIALS